MKILWLCNMIPSAVQALLGGSADSGMWVDHVLSDVRQREDVSMLLVCMGGEASGSVDARTGYALFPEKRPHVYDRELETRFRRHLQEFEPDAIHIWGTEYGHSLAMVHAARSLGMVDRVVISIQGLVGIYARHLAEGVPARVCRGYSLRNVLRGDNILQQQRNFEQRGDMERRALEQVRHVIGRTDWDRAITGQYNPDRIYHFCNETLRQPFYQGCWRYDRCKKHRIFTSSCVYPVKGFHYLLEAFCIILTRYPDATLSVTGDSFFAPHLKQKLRQHYYFHYLERFCRDRGLMDKIEFLGNLDAGQMKKAYLEANVFALPSTIENSPNSLGEAMLLGVPCVAADVGGVANMLHPGEGYVYQSTAPYMLASYIMEVFRQQGSAEEMGTLARAHALATHDPQRNLEALLSIYREISGKG
ncbi:MAG: glycosyltransferase family 4 protein [Faecousia sp.]